MWVHYFRLWLHGIQPDTLSTGARFHIESPTSAPESPEPAAKRVKRGTGLQGRDASAPLLLTPGDLGAGRGRTRDATSSASAAAGGERSGQNEASNADVDLDFGWLNEDMDIDSRSRSELHEHDFEGGPAGEMLD